LKNYIELVRFTMDKNIILFVFEGKHPEEEIFINLKSIFFQAINDNTILHAIYGGEIYQLWKLLEKDPYLDLFELIKDRSRENKNKLDGINKKNVSQIYLFFDHDSQSFDTPSLGNKPVSGMLDFFDNETENGKLFISYPMAEALKHFKKDPNECFKNCYFNLEFFFSYKNSVDKDSDFTNVEKYSEEIWFYLTLLNVQKAFCIIEGRHGIPDYKQLQRLNQKVIFESQKNNFIDKKGYVVILSAFPFFILDYFGEKIYNKMLENPAEKKCKFIHLIDIILQ
jgi:hypothetical protein